MAKTAGQMPVNYQPAPGWTAYFRTWYDTIRSAQRPEPTPLGRAEMRTVPPLERVPSLPWGTPLNDNTRRYSRGAARWAFQPWILGRDPMGGGVAVTRKIGIGMDRHPYTFAEGAIFWNAQAINGGFQPQLLPLYTPQQLTALGITSNSPLATLDAPSTNPLGGASL